MLECGHNHIVYTYSAVEGRSREVRNVGCMTKKILKLFTSPTTNSSHTKVVSKMFEKAKRDKSGSFEGTEINHSNLSAKPECRMYTAYIFMFEYRSAWLLNNSTSISVQVELSLSVSLISFIYCESL